MKKVLISIVIALAVMISWSQADALTTVHFGEDLNWANTSVSTNSDLANANFLSSLTGVGTEDFESFADGNTAPIVTDFGVAGTATLTGVGEVEHTATQASVGRIAYSGELYWQSNTGSFTIDFSNPVAAFGFYGIDLGDFSGQVTLGLTGGGAAIYDVAHTQGSAANGALLYWGIIETATFNSISISNTGSSADYFGFDDMTIGSLAQVSVPEASTMLLLGTCLSGLYGVRKKFWN